MNGATLTLTMSGHAVERGPGFAEETEEPVRCL
jgi:hypothetical protein